MSTKPLSFDDACRIVVQRLITERATDIANAETLRRATSVLTTTHPELADEIAKIADELANGGAL